jgi:DNA-binding GntR family transcriptional regulator
LTTSSIVILSASAARRLLSRRSRGKPDDHGRHGGRRHALEYHAAILESIRAGDPEQARRAMDDHIEQTQGDLRVYVLNAESSGDAV